MLGLLLVLALVVAACGEEGGDDTTTTAGEETTTTAAPDTTTTAGDTTTSAAAGGEVVTIEAGDSIAATFLPKCTNIAVFPQANSGAEEAAGELGSDPAEFVGPADCGDTTGQIEFMTNAVTQGVDAIMLSNNSGDQLDRLLKPPPTPGSRSLPGTLRSLRRLVRVCSWPRSTSTRPAR